LPAKRDHTLFLVGKYASLALLMPAAVITGYFLGAAADDWLHLSILKVVGILLGVGAGLTKILQELLREEKLDGDRQ
jgi:F0F1-type ATP synthase assembly protein I